MTKTQGLTALTQDSDNPALALQMISTTVLAMAARGEIDLNQFARQELASRGLNWRGAWIGFEKAAALAKMSPVRASNGRIVAVSIPEVK